MPCAGGLSQTLRAEIVALNDHTRAGCPYLPAFKQHAPACGRVCAEYFSRFDTHTQFERATDQIRRNVGFKDVSDRNLFLAGEFKVTFHVWKKMSKSAPSSSPARFIPPMKALGREQVPSGLWQCEVKFDGFRAIAVLNGGEAELWSRNHKPLSGDFPEVIAALRKLKCRNAVLDGEIVALDEAGRSRFQLLQARDLPGARPALVYYIFDLLHRDGRSLMDATLEERRRHLVSLTGKIARPLQLSPIFLVEPAELLAAARSQGLEGIIAKLPGSR